MALYHLINTLTNDAGDKLVGYFVRLTAVATDDVADIYANASYLPVGDVSGVENAAKTDETGLYSIYVEDGSYNIQFFDKNDANLLLRTINDVPMFGFNSAADALAAQEARAEAVTASASAVAAEAVVTAALLNGDAFTDTTVADAVTAGLAAAGEGEYFIATGDDIDEVRQYQDVSGTAELIFSLPTLSSIQAAVAAAYQGFELILQPDDGVVAGTWYVDYFRTVETEFTDLDFVLLGGGTCDISLAVNDIVEAGPFAVTTTADSETTSVTVAAGSRISVQVSDVTGAPTTLVVQWKGLPA